MLNLFAASESTSENFVSFSTPGWAWAAFAALVVVLLLVDLIVVHKEAHVVTTKEAAVESAVWISIGLAFGLVMWRSDEHTSELQSLMRISYAVFCLKKKNQPN